MLVAVVSIYWKGQRKRTKKRTKKKDKEKDKELSLSQVPSIVFDALSSIQKDILLLLADNPSISFKQLGKLTEMTDKKLRTQRSKLEKVNIYLVRIGSTKSGYWKIEYKN